MKNLKIAVAMDRKHIIVSWEAHGHYKEVHIPIDEYYESKLYGE